MKSIATLLTLISFLALVSCKEKTTNIVPEIQSAETSDRPKIKVIFDTDANNELDDQHALAYMFLNGGDVFDVKGITVNTTYNGKGIQGHYDEAERIMQLCNIKGKLPLLKGADANYKEIATDFDPSNFDGKEGGVDFFTGRNQR